ncbi:MAG TPA: protein-glutamate O-methyltransferase CheR [Gammaproteobacteria bacterium]|nr:protein-glutamate O-methyltransferase CheR [Gammaproteobacteria bacterium]
MSVVIKKEVESAIFTGIELLPDMSDQQFQCWVQLLESRIGMVLPLERRSFLTTNLGLRMREIGIKDYSEYYNLLTRTQDGVREWQILVDRVTVHETRFNRHPNSLEVIEAYIRDKKVDPASGRVNIEIWSTACATGEEAFTLAMCADRALSARPDSGYFGVMATDISQSSLQDGRRAVYSKRRMKDLAPELVDGYFEPAGVDLYRVVDSLRRRVCFSCVNIMNLDQTPMGGMDIIYCQNLLIYFDRPKREKIVNKLVEYLLPGGLLILGSGEIIGWHNDKVRKVKDSHTLAFQRLG